MATSRGSIRNRQDRSSLRTIDSVQLPRSKNEFIDPNSFSIQRLTQSQDSLADVLSIRDELLTNVFQKCYDNDIKKKTVSFLVRCAHKAILRIIDLQFYVHDYGNDDFSKAPAWTADEPPVPSPADTWAAYNVPIVAAADIAPSEEGSTDDQQKTEVPTEMSSLTDQSTPGSYMFSEGYGSHSISEYSDRLLGPNVSEALLPESDYEAVDLLEDVESEKSLFTRIATLDTDIDTSRVYGDYKRRETIKLPKVPKITHDTKAKPMEVKISSFTFPPLRADTILQRGHSPPKSDNNKRSSSSNK